MLRPYHAVFEKIVRESISPPAKSAIHSQRMEQAPSVRKCSVISCEFQTF